jgi:hypothetical protein
MKSRTPTSSKKKESAGSEPVNKLGTMMSGQMLTLLGRGNDMVLNTGSIIIFI